MELFSEAPSPANRPAHPPHTPLAERLRPRSIEQMAGQRHLIGAGRPVRTFLGKGRVPSMILWGPPGCGKTTLARLISAGLGADFYQLNAVSSGVGDLRKVIDRAVVSRKKLGRNSILFIDEIHRFNKAQQDALLHSVEDGTLTLIGATTENPSFEVISPLLSRCQVFTLLPLTAGELQGILDHALMDDPVLSRLDVRIGEAERKLLFSLSNGDARQLLNGLEAAVSLASPGKGGAITLTRELLADAFQRRTVPYDKSGEEHYNVISAFIKSVRGSDPDAAMYWMARMIEGGEDPKFIARRMIVLASEDIGNADPGALPLATACFTAVEYIGMPEARIVLAQTAAYLASAPKSNAAIRAIDAAIGDARAHAGETVPLHLRNAPTGLMKEIGYGKEYRYAHDYTGNFTEQQYLPDGLSDRIYYRPSGNGNEKFILERLNALWKKKQR